MEKRKITEIKSQFDETIYIVDDTDVEYWLARELMPLLGYERWETLKRRSGVRWNPAKHVV